MSDFIGELIAPKAVREGDQFIGDLVKKWCDDPIKQLAIDGRLTVDVYRNKREIWKLDGRPIFELRPPTFEMSFDGYQAKAKVEWQFREFPRPSPASD